MEQIVEKIKPMSLEEMTLATDRLTRFKFPDNKYNRVFREILAKYLITPKISFKEYENLDYNEISYLIKKIFNFSLAQISDTKYSCELYKFIIKQDQSIFNISNETKKLMNTEIPYEAILGLNKEKKLCKNLEFLKIYLNKNENIKKLRKKYKTLFPIEKIVLAEGITEEILLPKFAQILNYDFEENGIIVIPAGGKNQVAKEYIKIKEQIKIPIIILLDADATEIAQKISNKQREEDKLILIEKGEFEDILPLNLLKEAINYQFINIFKISESDFSTEINRVKNLEEIYRINGLGEFKKAEFAHTINTVLNSKSLNFISPEIKNIIHEIKEI